MIFKLHKLIHTPIWVLLVALLGQSQVAHAGRVEGTLGYFTIQAKTSEGSEKVANFGIATINLGFDLGQHVVIRPGYSLYVIGQSKLDIGYGFNLGAIWFPFSESGRRSVDTSGVSWTFANSIRPYFGGSFMQRQYQSIQSSYAGFSLIAGANFEWSILPQSTYCTVETNVAFLKGPLESEVSEAQILAGLGWEY